MMGDFFHLYCLKANHFQALSNKTDCLFLHYFSNHGTSSLTKTAEGSCFEVFN